MEEKLSYLFHESCYCMADIYTHTCTHTRGKQCFPRVSCQTVYERCFLVWKPEQRNSILVWPDSLTSVEVSRDLWLNRKEGSERVGGEWRSQINRLFHLQRCVSMCVAEMEEAVRWGVVRGMAKPNGQVIQKFFKKQASLHNIFAFC